MDSYTYRTLASNDYSIPTIPPCRPYRHLPASPTRFKCLCSSNVETEVALFSMSFKPPNGTDVVFVNALPSIVEQTVHYGRARI